MGLYEKSGTHDLVVCYNALYKEMSDLAIRIAEVQREHRSKLTPEYNYEVIVIDPETIKIIRKLANPKVFDEHLDIFGSLNNPPSDQETSVTYYRVNTVLLHKNGGYLILKDDAICSDEDWQSLLNGVIPQHLID
jgi:hypothetical protein